MFGALLSTGIVRFRATRCDQQLALGKGLNAVFILHPAIAIQNLIPISTAMEDEHALKSVTNTAAHSVVNC
jgi:hypothetical protein